MSDDGGYLIIKPHMVNGKGKAAGQCRQMMVMTYAINPSLCDSILLYGFSEELTISPRTLWSRRMALERHHRAA